MKNSFVKTGLLILMGIITFLAQNISITDVWASSSTSGYAWITGKRPLIASHANTTIYVKPDKTAYAYGLNSCGENNVSGWTNIKSVAAGSGHNLGLTYSGTVVAAGDNSYGQLNVSGWANITGIAAGSSTSVGLKIDGTVVAVGSNGSGQTNVSGWSNIVAVAAGPHHTVGLKSDGTVVAAGSNEYGQINVSGWTNIVAIAAGQLHTVGLKADGTVVAVGYNYYGQTNTSSWTNIVSIAAGHYHTLGLRNDRKVNGVGYNLVGQAETSAWTDISEIVAGSMHSIGVKTDGSCVAKGNDYTGNPYNVTTWVLNSAPSITLTSPSSGSYRSAIAGYNTLSVVGTIKDINAGHLNKVFYRIDGTAGTSGTQIGSDTTADGTDKSFTVTAIVGAASEGAHTIYIWGEDNYGGRSPETSRTFIMDKTTPTTPVLNLSTSNWSNTDVNFTITPGMDSGSGVLKSQYRLNSGTWTDYSTQVTIGTNGTYTVEIKTFDNVGNSSTTTSGTAKIDKTAPTTPAIVLSTTEWTTGSVTVNITPGTDALSGVLKTEYKMTTDGSWTLYNTGFTIYDVGITSIYARTTDNAGNYAEVLALVKVKNDTTGPLVNLMIANGATYITSTSTTLQITGIDNLTSAASLLMRFSNDNISWSSWEAYLTSKSWTVTSGDALKAVYVQLKDTDSNITSASDTVYLSSATPSNSSSSSSSGTLNGGSYYIKDNEVTISMNNAGAITIRYSVSEGVWSEWENSVSSKTLQLPSGDGKKKIQFQLKNSNEKPSSVYTINFVLDTAAPVFKLSTLNGATATSSGNITLEISELIDNVYITSFKYSINGGAQNPLPENNQIAITGLTTGLQTIRIRIYDQADNYSEKSVKVWRL